jgi:hypothetical protein
MLAWVLPLAGQPGSIQIGTNPGNAVTLLWDVNTAEGFEYNPNTSVYTPQNIGGGGNYNGIKVLTSAWYYIEVNASFIEFNGSQDDQGATILLETTSGTAIAYNQRPIVGTVSNHIGQNKITVSTFLNQNDIVRVKAWGVTGAHYYVAGDISMSRFVS